MIQSRCGTDVHLTLTSWYFFLVLWWCGCDLGTPLVPLCSSRVCFKHPLTPMGSSRLCWPHLLFGVTVLVMDLPRCLVLTWVQGSLSTDAAEGCGIYLLTILALGSHFLLLFHFIFPYVHVLRFSRHGVYPKLSYITHSLYRLNRTEQNSNEH